MVDKIKFGCSLDEARRRSGLTQQMFADRITDALENGSVSQQAVAGWCYGHSLPGSRDKYLALCQVLFHNRGLQSMEEMNKLLGFAGEGALHGFEIRQWLPELTPATEKRGAEDKPNDVFSYLIILNIFIIQSVAKAMNETFNWNEIPEYAQQSWAGKFVFAFSSVMKRITVEKLFAFMLSLLFFFAATWLITPMLQWPIPASGDRIRAAIMWAAASLIVPAAIALITTPDGLDRFQVNDRQKRRDLFLLKLIGAYNGFQVIALTAFLITLAIYYIKLGPLPDLLAAFFVLTTLVFTYVAARTTPDMRYRMFKGELKKHDFDPVFLLVFAGIGPSLALAFYFGYSTLIQPVMGLLVLITLAALILWEYRKKYSSTISDLAMVLLYGLAIPLVLLLIAFLDNPAALENAGFTEFIALAVLISLVLIETLMLAAVFVRHQPVLTLRGLLAVLGILLILAGAQQYGGLLAGRIAFTATILAAILFRRHYQKYLWLPSAFGVHQLLLLLFLILWLLTPISVWLILSPFLIISAFLIWNVYRSGVSSQ